MVRNYLRVFGAGLLLTVSIVCMVQFKQQHSAKETLREEGIRYYRMARYEDAADCFSLALKQQELFTEESDRDIYYYLADGEMKQEDYASAITYYEKLVQLKEESVDLYANMGICYEQLDKAEQAYSCFKQAVALEDSNGDIYSHLSQVCNKLGKTEECQEYAQKGYDCVKKQLSKNVTALLSGGQANSLTTGERRDLNQCGQLAYFSGNYQEAYQYYEILYQSGDSSAALYMGHCLAEAGEYERAMELLNAYKETDGDNPLADAKIVYCYMQLGQYEEALALVDEALNQEGQTLQQELLYEKGVALERKGEFDSAFDCFAQYVEQYPGEEKGKREYDFLVTRISDEKAAVAGVDNGN